MNKIEDFSYLTLLLKHNTVRNFLVKNEKICKHCSYGGYTKAWRTTHIIDQVLYLFINVKILGTGGYVSPTDNVFKKFFNIAYHKFKIAW